MKKVYTKPVMESEEFVSNEYVAACYLFECEGKCKGTEKVKDPVRIGELTKQGTGNYYIYTGTFAGNAAKDCQEYTEDITPDWYGTFWGSKLLWALIKEIFGGQTETSYYHQLTITSRNGWDNHPNASA